jgi:hypothetical protein
VIHSDVTPYGVTLCKSFFALDPRAAGHVDRDLRHEEPDRAVPRCARLGQGTEGQRQSSLQSGRDQAAGNRFGGRAVRESSSFIEIRPENGHCELRGSKRFAGRAVGGTSFPRH